MITNKETFNQIINLQKEIIDQVFDLHEQTLYVEAFKSKKWVNFENCTFNCDQLVFQNIHEPELTLEFKNCTFNCSVSFSNCTFHTLEFRNTKVIKSLEIHKGPHEKCISQLNVLYFSNDSGIERPQLSTKFSIRTTNIGYISFQKISHVHGNFEFLGNTVGVKEDNISSFQDSTITNVLFGKNSFLSFTTFKRVKFNTTPEYSKPVGSAYEFPGFYTNTFEKILFTESNFIDVFQFNKCDFLSTTWFENCKNIDNSELKFLSCKFGKYSLFDNSKFNKIEILHSKFLEKASFENFETKYFKIHQVTFAEAAYFDDLNRNNNKVIENWDRKTIRAIKKELQKAENRIDFNRFRAFELAAHYEELDWKWNSGFVDKSILFASKVSTDFGNSWRKALRFTVIGGFAFYLLLYSIENRNISIDISNWDNWARFFSGFFRFLLITDFYNPLETDRIYLTNPFCWVILIFGKIVIAFGIYEMIQSFRKFKA
jgi:hypothetical protein